MAFKKAKVKRCKRDETSKGTRITGQTCRRKKPYTGKKNKTFWEKKAILENPALRLKKRVLEVEDKLIWLTRSIKAWGG